MQSFPRTIHVGMDVYDSRHAHIGKVDDFKFPENATDPGVEPAEVVDEREPGTGGLLGVLAEAFGDDPVPDALRDRLLLEGYVRIDADGLFAGDRFITPDQIASANGDELVLRVERDALIKH